MSGHVYQSEKDLLKVGHLILGLSVRPYVLARIINTSITRSSGRTCLCPGFLRSYLRTGTSWFKPRNSNFRFRWLLKLLNQFLTSVGCAELYRPQTNGNSLRIFPGKQALQVAVDIGKLFSLVQVSICRDGN